MKPLRPLVRDRERPTDGSLNQNFPNPRAQSGPRRNNWNRNNNIPHLATGTSRNVTCYRCGIPGHVAPECRKFKGPTAKSPCTSCYRKHGKELFHSDCTKSNHDNLGSVNFIHVAPKNQRASKNALGCWAA